MNIQCLLPVALGAAVTIPSFAQETPEPPAELQKLQPMVGIWQGEGTVRQAPDATPGEWTATIETTPILGGFFLREEVHVDTGAEPLEMITIYGWDAEKRLYLLYGVDNSGRSIHASPTFVGDDKLVSVLSGHVSGEPFVARTTHELSDGKLVYRLEKAVGDGGWYTEVEGTFTKNGNGEARPAEAAAARGARAGTEMEKLTRLAGEYRIKGKMIPAPGAEEVGIEGVERLTPLWGGTVLELQTTGHPLGAPEQEYESLGFITWDPERRSYDSVGFDNMGMAHRSAGVFGEDGSMVFTSTATLEGRPSVMRAVLRAGDGGLESYTVHSMLGTTTAQQVFHCDYAKAGAGGK